MLWLSSSTAQRLVSTKSYPSNGGDNVAVLQQQIGRHLNVLQLLHYSYALVHVLPATQTPFITAIGQGEFELQGSENWVLPLTRPAALTTVQHYRADCDVPGYVTVQHNTATVLVVNIISG